MPVQPLEAAVQTWRRICTNPLDRKVEEELRTVSAASHRLPCPALPCPPPPVDPAGPALIGCTDLDRFISAWQVLTSRCHVEKPCQSKP